MKPLPSNALRTQLTHSQPAGPHPNADLLTAFAENTLLDRERTGILAHLASCPDCRAILHTAAAAEPEPDPQPEPLPTRPPIRTWLPGVALASSLLVMVASTILFYRALHINPTHTQNAANTASPPLPAASAPPAAPRHLRISSHAVRPTAAPTLATEEARLGAAAPPPPPAAGASSSVSLGDLSAQRAQNAPPAEQAQIHAQMQAEITAYRGAIAAAKVAPHAPASATESVQVESSNFVTRSLQTTHLVAGFISAPTSRPRFRITDSGQIERSIQPGIWMPVSIASDIHFRVISISGADVWVGGDHLRLLHSANSGLTWTELHLPATVDRTHAIVHIRIDEPRKLTVEDDAGSTWITTDAGSTWQ